LYTQAQKSPTPLGGTGARPLYQQVPLKKKITKVREMSPTLIAGTGERPLYQQVHLKKKKKSS
jgi:hypothetical protein